MAGFQPVSPNSEAQKWIAVLGIARCTSIKRKFFFRKHHVLVWKIRNEMLRQYGQILHGHALFDIWPAARIGKDGICHAQGLRPLGHHGGKSGLGAVYRQRLRNHRAGIIARQNNDSTNQVFHCHAICGVEKHGRPTIAHGMRGDGQFFVPAQPAIAQGFKRHEQCHQLGHRRRWQGHFCLLGQQHGPALLIDDIGGLSLGFKGLSRCAKYTKTQYENHK